MTGHENVKQLGNIALVVMIGLLTVILAACSEDTASEPIIEDVWARPGAEGDNTAAYLSIENDGDTDIALAGVSGDVAQAVEVHESTTDEGMMVMEEVEEVPIPAGETVMLEPGGFHVMIMNLESDLNPGDTFTLSLQFEELDDIEVDVTVEDQ